MNGNKMLISPEVIAGPALLTGATASLPADRGYSWWDSYANPGTRYWIEELDISGERTFYGPVIARCQEPVAHPQSKARRSWTIWRPRNHRDKW